MAATEAREAVGEYKPAGMTLRMLQSVLILDFQSKSFEISPHSKTSQSG